VKARRDRLAFAPRHALRCAPGSHARQKKRLVGIDIPDTRRDRLVEQHRLDRDATAAVRSKEGLARKVERIGSQTVEPRVGLAFLDPLHLAKFPNVPEENPGTAALQGEGKMGVFIRFERALGIRLERGSRGRREQTHARRLARKELTRHPQMEQKPIPSAQVRDEIFSCARKRFNAPPLECAT